MNKILFIFNWLVKSWWKVWISGWDIRLFEIIKNAAIDEINLLTTPNGEELVNKLSVPFHNKYVIKYNVNSWILSNLVISIKSFFCLPKDLKKFHWIVYSSCEHLYDVLPWLRMKLFNKCTWYAVYHWVEDYPWKEKRWNTPFLRRYLYWLNRWFSWFIIKIFSDKILAVSDQTKEKLIKIKWIDPKKIKAVYCWVNYNLIRSIWDKYLYEKWSKYDAVFMKRLNYWKWIIDLLEIWKKVCKIKKNAKLAIIGDWSEDVVKKIKWYINDNNLEKNIDLLWVIYDIDEKFKILNSSKLFILPSHEENWAIVIWEAMAIKLPTIVYSLKEILPIWKDNVEWVSVWDVSQFANKIISYLDNNQKCIDLSNKAFDFIQDYDWSVISKNEFKN